MSILPVISLGVALPLCQLCVTRSANHDCRGVVNFVLLGCVSNCNLVVGAMHDVSGVLQRCDDRGRVCLLDDVYEVHDVWGLNGLMNDSVQTS